MAIMLGKSGLPGNVEQSAEEATDELLTCIAPQSAGRCVSELSASCPHEAAWNGHGPLGGVAYSPSCTLPGYTSIVAKMSLFGVLKDANGCRPRYI
jgi:hypothetical protein